MITIGHLAKTYGLLPSEVVARATTFDMMVTDVCATWEQFKNDPKASDNFDPEQLATVLAQTRS
jgi:hypothetical protein